MKLEKPNLLKVNQKQKVRKQSLAKEKLNQLKKPNLQKKKNQKPKKQKKNQKKLKQVNLKQIRQPLKLVVQNHQVSCNLSYCSFFFFTNYFFKIVDKPAPANNVPTEKTTKPVDTPADSGGSAGKSKDKEGGKGCCLVM